MTQFCFMRDMCAHMGAPGHYLTHQNDTQAVDHRFRDLFSRESRAPYYGRYRYLRMETPIQLGGPVSQQPHRSPFQPLPQQHQTPQRQSGLMSPLSAFVHGNHGPDLISLIDFDVNMQERDANDTIQLSIIFLFLFLCYFLFIFSFINFISLYLNVRFFSLYFLFILGSL